MLLRPGANSQFAIFVLGVIRKRFAVMQKTLNGANFVIK